MKPTIEQQMKRLEIQENKLLNQTENTLTKSTIAPVMNKIQNKIPEKLKTVLNSAFYKGFQLVFEKGSPYIEKTYNKDKLETEFDINNYAIDRKLNKKHMMRLDKQSMQSKLVNSSFTVLEGGVLGFLGIGIPDIPLFLSVIIKTIYEVALSYGFHYDTQEEKVYILLLIRGAIAKPDSRKECDNELEKLGADIDQNIVSQVNLNDQMKVTAEALSDSLLTAKFVQGIPIVGAVGGIVNYNILNRISSYARLKYKKRYLIKKSKAEQD